MLEPIETLIIGAGHAGLSTSYYLKQQGREHIVLDKASQPASAWRSERWDSFTFVTPNWSFLLPGGEYDGPDPDGFMTRDELVSRFDRYVEKNQLPVVYNSCVTSIQRQDGKGYLVRTTAKDYLARNVVAANGWFREGKTPSFGGKIPSTIVQLHSSSYKNPQSLPDGAVLIVGSGQSGGQIAEELYQTGRKVFLSTGTAPHAPRRYRGKDVIAWMIESGFTDRTYEQFQSLGKWVAGLISGKDGGHALNLHKFYRDGVILLGHARDYVDGMLILAADLKENLVKADMGQKFLLKTIDDYIQRAGLNTLPEEFPVATDAYQAQEITNLDLQAEGISTVIWSCGYTYDSSIFQFPVLNQSGFLDAPLGASPVHPGLYFVGMPFIPSLKSAFIFGIPQSATNVVERICRKEV